MNAPKPNVLQYTVGGKLWGSITLGVACNLKKGGHPKLLGTDVPKLDIAAKLAGAH